MKQCPTFGVFILMPKCMKCEDRHACIQVTLGNLAERGCLRERFDLERNELVYSLTNLEVKRAVEEQKQFGKRLLKGEAKEGGK